MQRPQVIPNAAGGTEGAASSPAGPGQSSGEGELQKSGELQQSGILRYKIQRKNSTLWFSFLPRNEFKRKDHPSDAPDRADDTFAQILPS